MEDKQERLNKLFEEGKAVCSTISEIKETTSSAIFYIDRFDDEGHLIVYKDSGPKLKQFMIDNKDKFYFLTCDDAQYLSYAGVRWIENVIAGKVKVKKNA